MHLLDPQAGNNTWLLAGIMMQKLIVCVYTKTQFRTKARAVLHSPSQWVILFGVYPYNIEVCLHWSSCKCTHWLTLGAHVLQGYSSWACLCVQFAFFHTVTNRPRRPMDRLNAAIDWFKMWGFHRTASLHSYRIRVAATSAPVSHFACHCWRKSIYLITWRCSWPRGVLIAGFAIVSTRHYIAHVHISLDVDLELHVVLVRPKKGMSSAQSSMRRGFSTLMPSLQSVGYSHYTRRQ